MSKHFFAMMKFLACLVLWSFGSVAHGQVATQIIDTTTAGSKITIRTFYPTPVDAPPRRFGPWVVPLVVAVEPSRGMHPLVVISHGRGGNTWNHHLLAQALVRAGFIVAAVQHPGDRTRSPQDYTALRPQELSATIEAVLSHPLGAHIDKERIGAFGFSLGGYTVLALAGGVLDPLGLEKYCKMFSAREFYQTNTSSGSLSPQSHDDPRLKAIVLAAPVGVMFSDLRKVKIPVMLYRAGADSVLHHPHHAEHIYNLLVRDAQPPLYHIKPGVGHYAFLSPFPASIAAEVGAPAHDPEGFHRLAFLENVNTEIVSFFEQHLR